MSGSLIVAASCRLQDEHGEVCPANWHEGGKTIKADPKGSLEYFSSATNGANGANGHAEANGANPKKRARVD